MKMSKVFSRFLALIMLLTFLCPCVMADEIGEMATPAPAQKTDGDEIGEMGAVTVPAGESAPAAVPAGLRFTLDACVFDEENQWLYSTGNTVSWHNLPEGCKVGYVAFVYNDNTVPVTIELGDIVDGQSFTHGEQTINDISYLRLRRWFDDKSEEAFAASVTIGGVPVISRDIVFNLDGAPAGLRCEAGICEIAGDRVIAELGDSAKWSALDVGSSLGYYLTVWNEGEADITVTVVEFEDGKEYVFAPLTIAPGKAYRLPNAVSASYTGEKQLYWVVNGEKILDKTLTYEQ